MAPAAVDFQSPVTSKSSSHQNPNQNPNFTPFYSFSSADDHQQSVVFGNASDFDANDGVASRNGFRIGLSESGRTRPRLVKVRKQLHGRSKGVSGESGSGLNPFQSVSESSNHGNDCPSISNRFPEKCMSNGIHCPSVSFNFGSSGSSCTSNLAVSGNLDSKQTSFNMNVDERSFIEESADSKSNTFVFGDRQNNFNGDVDKPFSKTDNGKLNNACFGFGAEQRQSGENEGEPISKVENGKLHNLGFVFGVTGNNVETKSDVEKRRECGLDSGTYNVGKVSLGIEVEHWKNSFESGADKSITGSNLNFVKGQPNGNAVELDSNNVGFKFVATDNTSRINMGLFDTNFLFGANWSNLNDNKESSGSLQNLVSHENKAVKIKVEGETAHEVNGTAFMFDVNGAGNWKEDNDKVPPVFDSNSSFKKSSSSTENAATNCPDEVKSMSEILGRCNSIANSQNGTLDSRIDGKCKLASHESSSSVANACTEGPAFNLSDELQKLDISSFMNVDGADHKKSSTNGDAFFEFRSNKMASASSNGTFGSIHEPTSGGLSNAANGIICGQFESTDKNESHNVATASIGISSSETFRFQAGAATSSAEGQLSHGNLIDETHVNVATAPSPLLSNCLDSAPPVSWVEENNGTCSANTSDRLRVPCTDFETPKWDPSSLKASLFPEVNEKLDFSLKGKSKKGRKSKTMRRKLKLLSQSKQQHEQDQVQNYGNVQEVLNSPGCYSPMDFSPYQENIMTCFSNTEQVCSDSGAGVASAEDASGLSGENNHRIEFGFASGLENIDGKFFSFSASSSASNKVSAAKRLHRKKYRTKVSCEPFVIAANQNIKEQGDLSASQRILGIDSEANQQVNRGSAPTVTIQEACETWRLRGNQAYKNGDTSKAEEYYTQGIKSVPPSESSGSCLKPLVICYSNRAATRMSLGNLREALSDCAKAAALDPRFLKVLTRAANCHLMLGEIEKAHHFFNQCLESGVSVCLDRRITIEAADGLQKTEKVIKCTNHLANLLEQRTSDAALSALEVVEEALSISPYSERLLETKAESWFLLRKYEEVIQLCKQTLCFAEKNFTSSGSSDQFADKDASQAECHSFVRLWRWHLISKSYFYLGKLEVALDLLEKLEQMGSISDKYANKTLESSVSLAVTIRSLIHHKSAGNEAVRSGRYAEALEHYSAAISSNVESRPFAAICFCNRAAAHQALGQITDAIADCSLAIALDGNYSKAVSRRATLHEMIRDYGQAASDLRRVISLLENPSDGKAKQSGTPGRSVHSTKELRQAHRHLSLMEEETKEGLPLNLYLILGIKQSDSAADVKKAYRKAALRHHPDKAGQFLARSESGDEGRLWKDIIQEVHMDADRLFKMIGEAYAVLSDPTKRSEYDADEAIRKASKENNGSYHSRRTTDSHNYTYGRRNCQDNWKTYGHSHSQW